MYYNLLSMFLPIFATTKGVTCVISKLYRFATKYSAAEVMSSWYEYNNFISITVAVRFKAWFIVACSDAGVVSSNSSRGMDIYMCVYSFFPPCMLSEPSRRIHAPV
jgi:hypothetical protein